MPQQYELPQGFSTKPLGGAAPRKSTGAQSYVLPEGFSTKPVPLVIPSKDPLAPAGALHKNRDLSAGEDYGILKHGSAPGVVNRTAPPEKLAYTPELKLKLSREEQAQSAAADEAFRKNPKNAVYLWGQDVADPWIREQSKNLSHAVDPNQVAPAFVRQNISPIIEQIGSQAGDILEGKAGAGRFGGAAQEMGTALGQAGGDFAAKLPAEPIGSTIEAASAVHDMVNPFVPGTAAFLNYSDAINAGIKGDWQSVKRLVGEGNVNAIWTALTAAPFVHGKPGAPDVRPRSGIAGGKPFAKSIHAGIPPEVRAAAARKGPISQEELDAAMQRRLRGELPDDELMEITARVELDDTPGQGGAYRITTRPNQPSPAPVSTVPPAASGTPQGGAASTGQQSAAGARPLPTLNASPVQAPVGPPGYTIPMAKSDAKIIGRILRDGNVPRNDVVPLLTDTVSAYQRYVAQAYQRGEQPRLFLAAFAEEYLPTRLPQQVADDVKTKLRAFGNAANARTNPRDPSRAVVQRTASELRGSQEGYLTEAFEKELGDESLLTKQGKIRGDKSLNADAVYKTQLDLGQQRLASGKATPKETAALEQLLARMKQKSYFNELPKELKVEAENDPSVGNLWEYVNKKPLEAAHWLQSKLGVLARKGGENAGLYKQMRRALLRPLEDAVPGYRGARMRAGDLVGQEIAVNFGDDLFRNGMTDLQTGQMELDYKKLSPAQKIVADRSIRDKLKNEFRRLKEGETDPITGVPIDSRGAKIDQLQKAGTLEALERVLGDRGKRIADAIRTVARENPRIPSYGSDSAKNLAEQKAVAQIVRSPFNRAVQSAGDKTSFAWTVPMDIAAPFVGAPPIFTASKLAGMGVERLGNPGAKQLGSATKTLYGLPPAPPTNGLLAAPKTRVAGPPKARAPKPPATPEMLDGLLNEYNALNHGRAPKKSEDLAKRIIRVRKELEAKGLLKVSAPSKPLTSPPTPTGGKGAVKAGIGGGSQTNLPPEMLGGVIGGYAGYEAAPDDKKGLGLVAGAVGGAGLGRLVRGGGAIPAGVPIKTPKFDGKAKLQELLGEPSKYLPWRGNPQYKELAARAGQTVIDVPVANIVPGQSQIRHNFKDVQSRYGAGDDELPIVVRENGKFYINDGTHRIAAKVSDGAQTVRARVIDLDAVSGAESRPIGGKGSGSGKGTRDGQPPSPPAVGKAGEANPLLSAKGPPAPIGGNGLLEVKGPPRVGKSPLPTGALARPLSGAAIGAMVGSSADAQQGFDPAQLEAVNNTISELEADLRIYDKGTAKEVQELLLRRGKGKLLGPRQVDGVIGKATSDAIAADKKETEARLIEARKRQGELETAKAYAETAPSDAMKTMREAGPIGGAIVGLLLGVATRSGAVRGAVKKSAARVGELNALLTPGPVAPPRSAAAKAALAQRVTNINDFWRRGGAGENVPFTSNKNGEWRPRPKASSPSSLYPEPSNKLRSNDYGVITSALAESGLATIAQGAAQKEIDAAQAEVDKNPTKANLERLENARTMYAIATTAQRLGLAFAGMRTASALKLPYRPSRPNIGEAEREMGLIKQQIKGPPKK